MSDFDPSAYAKESDDFDPDSYGNDEAEPKEAKEKPQRDVHGFIANAAATAADAIDFIDSYTSAPVRAGIGAMQEGKGVGESLEAGWDAVGEPTGDVPTGKDIMSKAGVSTKEYPTFVKDPYAEKEEDRHYGISPAGVAGTALDVAIDPTNLLTFGGGALAKKGVKAGAKLAPKVAKYLSGKGKERAAKAVVGQDIKKFRKIAGIKKDSSVDPDIVSERLQKFGGRLLDEPKKIVDGKPKGNVVGTFNSADEIGAKAAKRKKHYGEQIGKIQEVLDDKFPGGVVDGADVAADLRKKADEIDVFGGGDKIKDAYLKEADKYEEAGYMSFKRAQKSKGQYKYAATSNDTLLTNQDAINDIRDSINKAMEDSADDALREFGDLNNPGVLEHLQLTPEQTELIKNYKQIKGDYGTFSNAAGSGSERLLKGVANRVASPTDMLSGSTGALLGGTGMIGSGAGGMTDAMLAGVVFAGANHLMRIRGNPAVAKSLIGLGNRIKQGGKFTEKYGNMIVNVSQSGPQSLIVNHHLMMNTNPEYKKLFEGNEK